MALSDFSGKLFIYYQVKLMVAVSPREWSGVTVPKSVRKAIEWVVNHEEQYGIGSRNEFLKIAIYNLLTDLGYFRAREREGWVEEGDD